MWNEADHWPNIDACSSYFTTTQNSGLNPTYKHFSSKVYWLGWKSFNISFCGGVTEEIDHLKKKHLGYTVKNKFYLPYKI